MSDGNSIINLGNLTEPATLLIEKIFDAGGSYFKPYQIVRVARAEAEANKIRATSSIEIEEIEQRAAQRFLNEQIRKQKNVESIVGKAIPQLKESARPQNIEDDWIFNFFDKASLISDEQIQRLWADLLASEANQPGVCSRRTINILSSLDKKDAVLFTDLCRFVWRIEESLFPVILYDGSKPTPYSRRKMYSQALMYLDEIGLLNFRGVGSYAYGPTSSDFSAYYYGYQLNIHRSKTSNNGFPVGQAVFTKSGKELAKVCGSEPETGFVDYVVGCWDKPPWTTSSPFLNPQLKKTILSEPK